MLNIVSDSNFRRMGRNFRSKLIFVCNDTVFGDRGGALDILSAGQFCALRLNSVKSSGCISPNRRSTVRDTAYACPPQLRKDLKSTESFFPLSSQVIEFLRSYDGTGIRNFIINLNKYVKL
jgi:hypothetical protein